MIQVGNAEDYIGFKPGRYDNDGNIYATLGIEQVSVLKGVIKGSVNEIVLFSTRAALSTNRATLGTEYSRARQKANSNHCCELDAALPGSLLLEKADLAGRRYRLESLLA